MNKLYLITTKGCEGCAILDNIVKSVLSKIERPVSYNVIDVANSEQINEFPFPFIYKTFTDFPSLVFVVGDELKFIHTGTCTKTTVREMIDRYFI